MKSTKRLWGTWMRRGLASAPFSCLAVLRLHLFPRQPGKPNGRNETNPHYMRPRHDEQL